MPTGQRPSIIIADDPRGNSSPRNGTVYSARDQDGSVAHRLSLSCPTPHMQDKPLAKTLLFPVGLQTKVLEEEEEEAGTQGVESPRLPPPSYEGMVLKGHQALVPADVVFSTTATSFDYRHPPERVFDGLDGEPVAQMGCFRGGGQGSDGAPWTSRVGDVNRDLLDEHRLLPTTSDNPTERSHPG